MNAGVVRQLRHLAELNGVQTSFADAANKQIVPSPKVLAGVLNALGIPAANEREIRESVRASALAMCRQGLEPVKVQWEKSETKIVWHVPAALAKKPPKISLVLEDGSVKKLTSKFRELCISRIEGEQIAHKALVLDPLPYGYHRL